MKNIFILLSFLFLEPSLLFSKELIDEELGTNNSFASRSYTSQFDLSLGLGMPVVRTNALNEIGDHGLSKMLSFSYYPLLHHGLTLGLGFDSYGQGGKISAQTQKFNDEEKNELNAINLFLAYTGRLAIDSKNHSFLIGDLGAGIYRPTGLQNNKKYNIFSLTQRVNFAYLLPREIQMLNDALMLSEISIVHSWISKTSINGFHLEGHSFGFFIGLRLGYLTQ